MGRDNPAESGSDFAKLVFGAARIEVRDVDCLAVSGKLPSFEECPPFLLCPTRDIAGMLFELSLFATCDTSLSNSSMSQCCSLRSCRWPAKRTLLRFRPTAGSSSG
jgi:hypothetical protein